MNEMRSSTVSLNIVDDSERATEPRDQAEARLAQRDGVAVAVPTVQTLLHEIRLHEVELAIQHEELRRTRMALIEAHDRYRNLYDLAPNGYLTLARDGIIADANLAAASMLGHDRRTLRGRRFAATVADEDRDRWHRHMWHGLRHDGKYDCDIELVRRDGTPVYCHIASLRNDGHGTAPELHLAVTDTGDRRRVRADRLRAGRAAAEIAPAAQATVAEAAAPSPLKDRLAAVHLTRAEMRVALLVAQGLSTKTVARALGVSPETVGIHRKQVRRKLGVEDRRANLYAHLALIATETDPS
jgi:PAS domain S-box-containing protein